MYEHSQAVTLSRRPHADQSWNGAHVARSERKATMNTSVMGELPRVEAALPYLEPRSDKPPSLEYEPPPGVPRTTALYRAHTDTISNIPPLAPPPPLHSH